MALSREQLSAMGFGSVGREVRVHETAQFFGSDAIHLGDDVRIDCFAVITAGPGEVRLGRNVHLGAGVQVFGAGGVTFADFSGASGRSSVYSVTDDFVGGAMAHPTVPERFRHVTAAEVRVGKHAVIGAGSVVLPGVTLGYGAAIGALSLVRSDVPDCAVMGGNPLRLLGQRDGRRLAALEAEYLASLDSVG